MSSRLDNLVLWLREPDRYWLQKHGLRANGGTLVIIIDPVWPKKEAAHVRVPSVDRYSVTRSSWPDDGPYGMEHSATVRMLLTTGEIVSESAERLTVKVDKP